MKQSVCAAGVAAMVLVSAGVVRMADAMDEVACTPQSLGSTRGVTRRSHDLISSQWHQHLECVPEGGDDSCGFCLRMELYQWDVDRMGYYPAPGKTDPIKKAPFKVLCGQRPVKSWNKD
jgi:hypothetical protein